MAIRSLAKPVYVLLFVLGSHWASASQTIDMAKMKACALTPADIKAALDLDVKPGKPQETPYPGGKSFNCAYDFTSGMGHIGLRQDWIPLDSLAASLREMDKLVAGKKEGVSSDPDKAIVIIDQYMEGKITLSYVRTNVRTEVLVMGSGFKARDMQPKLLKLKRVP